MINVQFPDPGSQSPAPGGPAPKAPTAALSVVNVLINDALDGRHACYLAYVVATRTLVLVDDAGDAGGPYAGSVTLGSAATIQNSQCAVNLISALDNGKYLALTLNITMKPGFGGNRIHYIASGDTAGNNTGWLAAGLWRVPPTPSGQIVVTGANPPRGPIAAGTPQSFAFTFTDSKGTANFGVIDVLANYNFIDGRGACYLAYASASNALMLVDDAGDGGGPFAGSMVLNGGAGTIQNSQCSVSGAGSSAVASGNTLTLTLNITFKKGFTGDHAIWAAGRDRSDGNNTGWQAIATASVQ